MNNLLESGVMGDGMNEDFLKGFEGNNFENFTGQLLSGLIKKDVLYEPLLESKKQLTELMEDPL